MAFSWSFSKIKNFETCGKKHYEVDIAKNYKDSTTQLDWGNSVHKALALACKGDAPLPPEHAEYQGWVDKINAIPGKLLVEQQYAITREFMPCAWFSKNAWLRVIADAIKLTSNNTFAWVIDWKTGGVKPDEYRPQLMLVAQALFSHMPNLKTVRSDFVWLKEDCNTKGIFQRADMPGHWASFLPRVETYREAIEKQNFPPKPSGLCKRYCPVTACPFHGKGAY